MRRHNISHTGRTTPRIAFVSTVYDHTDVGGGTFVHYLRQAAADGRLDLTFFSDDIRSPQLPSERRIAIPSTVKRLPGGWLTRAWYYHHAVLEEHSRSPFDIVWHNNAITGVFDVARGLTIPVVGMINDYHTAESNTPFATAANVGRKRAAIRCCWHQVERFVAKRLDRVIINSDHMANLIRDAYDLKPERLRLLYKGVSLEHFPFSKRESLHDPVRVLFVKRDCVRGGIFDLLRALEQFPVPVALTVVGPPSELHAEIRAAAHRAGVSDVNIFGHVPRSEMPSYFQDHDILCVPSRSEALGVAFMEGLASGLPVVATDVGGIPEVLDQGRAGWLAPPCDPPGLRRCLLQLIHDDEERTKRTLRGIEYVGRFTVDAMVDEMAEIAAEVAGRAAVLEVAT